MENVIAYNLTPSQKAKLVQMAQTEFHQNPCVLAIGDGYNDMKMLEYADISIEIIHKVDILNHFIMLNNLKTIKLGRIKYTNNILQFR